MSEDQAGAEPEGDNTPLGAPPVNPDSISKTGRPSAYTPERATEICDRYAMGETLIAICRDEHMPSEVTVRGWYMYDRPGVPWEGFSALYARARAMQVEHELEELRHIADSPLIGEETSTETDADGKATKTVVKKGDMLGHRKLQADARKWRISKLAWREYGVKPGEPPAGDSSGAGEKIIIEGGLPSGDHEG